MTKHRALTLVEILVAIAVGTLLLVALYSVYIVSSKSYRRGVNQEELAQNARISLERISRDLRQTERIVTELPPDNTDPLNPPLAYLQFQDGHNTNQVQYIKYYLDSSNLKRQVVHYYFSNNPGTWVAWNAQDQFGNSPQESIDEDVVKADKISALTFYGEKVISIDLQVTNGEFTFDFQTKVWGRNIQ